MTRKTIVAIKTHLKNTALKQRLPKKQVIYWLLQYYRCFTSIKTANAYIRNQVTEFQKFLKLQDFCLIVCFPVVRPGYTRCMAPEFLHDKGIHVGFMKPLFRWTFIHCTMVFPFILYYLALSLNHLQKGEKLANLCW